MPSWHHHHHHYLLFMQGIFMLTSGFFRLLADLPKPFWRYPISYISYGSWGLQVSLHEINFGYYARG
jgi:hypothetical protein